MNLDGWIAAHDGFAVVSHVAPDGDTLGSALALGSALRRMGKRAACVCHDPVPAMLAFLPGADTVTRPEKMPFVPEAVLFVDVAAADRAGDALRLAEGGTPSAVLDHHGTNPGFGDVNEIDADAGATGVMVAETLFRMGMPLTRDEALCLYAAISTDTGNFSFGNTDARALRAAADCLETGFDIAEASRRLFRLRRVSRTLLLGEALTHIRFLAEGRVAYVVLTEDMFQRCGARREDTEGLINFLNEMEGVEIAFTAEDRGRTTKFSLRSVAYADVAKIAGALGGGGHARAAGATIEAPCGEAVETMCAMVLKAL